MVNLETPTDDTVPVFMPPRKRQTSKKTAGGHNYVDHIVCVQVKQKMVLIEIYSVDNCMIKIQIAAKRPKVSIIIKFRGFIVANKSNGREEAIDCIDEDG